MGTRRDCHQKGKYGKYKFKYLPEWDVYICSEHKYLEYCTTVRNGYKEYKCKGDRCANCPRREMCLSAKQERKSLRLHIWEDYKDMAYAFTHTEKGKKIMPAEKRRWSVACRLQRTTRSPLLPFSGAFSCCRAVPAHCCGTEYEKNRHKCWGDPSFVFDLWRLFANFFALFLKNKRLLVKTGVCQ